jgi:hypothetical protein
MIGTHVQSSPFIHIPALLPKRALPVRVSDCKRFVHNSTQAVAKFAIPVVCDPGVFRGKIGPCVGGGEEEEYSTDNEGFGGEVRGVSWLE